MRNLYPDPFSLKLQNKTEADLDGGWEVITLSQWQKMAMDISTIKREIQLLSDANIVDPKRRGNAIENIRRFILKMDKMDLSQGTGGIIGVRSKITQESLRQTVWQSRYRDYFFPRSRVDGSIGR